LITPLPFGYEQNGLIAFGAAATYETATTISDYTDVSNLAKAVTFAARGECDFFISPGMLSQQFSNGYITTPFDDLPSGAQPTAIQGYILVATSNTGVADGTVLGRLTVSYSCTLTKAQVAPTNANPAPYIVSCEMAATATPIADLIAASATYSEREHENFSIVSPSANHLTITATHRRPYLVRVVGSATTASSPVLTFGSVVGGTVSWSRIAGNSAGYGGTSTWIIKPSQTNSQLLLENATDHWGTLQLSCEYIRSRDIPYMVDGLTP